MRPDKDIHFLNKVLFTRVRSFAKYSPEQRVQFCRVMAYEAHPKGAMILRQGHIPYFYYFLFSGQCEVLKDRTDGLDGQVRVHILNAGLVSSFIKNDRDPFGAVALEGLLTERRSATVVCTVPSIFLLVDKGMIILLERKTHSQMNFDASHQDKTLKIKLPFEFLF